MEKRNFEEELKKERRLVGNLLYEIEYRKKQLSEMEHKHNETTSTLRGHIDCLMANVKCRDCTLQDWKLRYNGSVRQLMDENAALREEIRKGNEENIRLKCEPRLQTKELEECKTKKVLEETFEALEDLKSRYSCLMVKHLLANQELQDARKESIQGLNDILNTKTTLGIKRMGDIDQKAFEVAFSQKLPNEDWRETCATLCSLWQQNVQDSEWHPFKMIDTEGNLQEVIDEDDEKLKELRKKYGDTVFEAVGAALMEMNEYNASGRYPVPEVWNRKEERRATMKEIVEYLIKQLKIHKGKGKRKRSSSTIFMV
ncbi:factor of DNA methylation 4-like [Hibiscus syriacus]|uniref:factor of DNA methylation 4-like n=1 Tax=Hibiscus syriacus TaxID=106335 RepID=UPI001921B2F5|nr:factor of DNA methylation 4-like [Hibiscus syriacus]